MYSTLGLARCFPLSACTRTASGVGCCSLHRRQHIAVPHLSIEPCCWASTRTPRLALSRLRKHGASQCRVAVEDRHRPPTAAPPSATRASPTLAWSRQKKENVRARGAPTQESASSREARTTTRRSSRNRSTQLGSMQNDRMQHDANNVKQLDVFTRSIRERHAPIRGANAISAARRTRARARVALPPKHLPL